MPQWAIRLANKAWSARFGDPTLGHVCARDELVATVRALKLPIVRYCHARGLRLVLERAEPLNEPPVPRRRRTPGRKTKRETFLELTEGKGSAGK